MSRWETGADVVLQVVGKYSILGTVVEPEWEDGRVKVQWEDRTTTIIRGDLLVTPGAAAVVVDVDELLAEVTKLREVVDGSDHYAAKYWRERAVAVTERDRARGLATRLEAQLAQVEEIASPILGPNASALPRLWRIRDILAVTL